VTDTIGWGDVDAPPRQLPRLLRLSRRRRVALVVVAALIAGGVVGWPPFRSWRADEAARQVQRLWARMEGLDNRRIQTLAAAQRTAGSLDRVPFARAVVAIDTEEAADLDRLVQQARSMRTWTNDVTVARKAVIAAMVTQAKALRDQAAGLVAISVDLPLTTSVDATSSAAADEASVAIDRLQSHRHLLPVGPIDAHFSAAAGVLAALLRPTDQPLHLRLVTSGSAATLVTDLDTGKVLLDRALDTNDSNAWQPDRVVGDMLLGTVEADVLFVPLTPGGQAHRVANVSVQSSVGSPVWVQPFLDRRLQAVDVDGRRVGRPVTLPPGLTLIGMGTPNVLLAASAPPDAVTESDHPTTYYLFDPRTGRVTRLATIVCPQLPSFGGVVVLPGGPKCDYATALDIFDLAGRHTRTVTFPRGDVLESPPVCSDDGAHVALLTSPRPAAENVEPPTVLRVLDTRTGVWTTVHAPPGWVPLEWSSDNRTLLMQRTNNNLFDGTQQFGELGYLQVGDTTLHSIRVAADMGDFLS
jgi:hypothetical protein